MREYFRRFAEGVSKAAGMPVAFVLALAVIVVWLMTGPIFHFSDTWQLIINTGTTIVTFLMVFVLQNTTNRESKATQIKLDELIRAIHAARTSFVDLEDLSDAELDRLEAEFRRMGEKAGAARTRRRKGSAGTPRPGGETKRRRTGQRGERQERARREEA